MDMEIILFSGISIGGLGLLFGLGLNFAAKKFAVAVDPMFPEVRNALPGANCGACGFAGCDAFAKAICNNEAEITGCPVGGSDTVEALSKILGVEATAVAKEVAYVKCAGTCHVAKEKYIYDGVMDCKNAAFLQGKGSKQCEYGCLGYGSCVSACEFGAIDIVDGIAVINEEKCVACGKCIATCPKALIEMIPQEKEVRVSCNSREKGKAVKTACDVGCISCRMCVKACEFDAIVFENNIAKVDYSKCTECNACADKCPTKAITHATKLITE